jgi:probable rRNA maturation factor
MDLPGDIGPDDGDGQPAEGEPPQRLRFVIELAEEGGDWSSAPPLEPLAARVADAVARRTELAGRLPEQALACIALADDATVRDLNARYRGKDSPTNVLSFPAGPTPADPDGRVFLGDVVLAQETVAAEAQERGLAVGDHLQHLMVHGILHLLDLDHETDAEAAEMEALEQAILTTLGVADPYRDLD